MNNLVVTFMSVGNGDSILLEYSDSTNEPIFGLIDTNDSVNHKSTYIYLKRFFELRGIKRIKGENLFEFIMLSHAHADHLNGLQNIIKIYGANTFYHSSSIHWGGHAPLEKFLHRSSNIGKVVPVNTSHTISFGNARLEILWPISKISSKNENNNSIVALLSHLGDNFIFSGDTEYPVWSNPVMEKKLRSLHHVDVFKVPHHGAVNGTLDKGTGKGTWSNSLSSVNYAVISCHVVPYRHPDRAVVTELNKHSSVLYTATNQHQNIEFTSSQFGITVKRFQ